MWASVGKLNLEAFSLFCHYLYLSISLSLSTFSCLFDTKLSYSARRKQVQF